MTTKIHNPKTYLLIIFIAFIATIRIYLSTDENMFGLSNFSPVGAMAIFSGAYFTKKWKALLFPMLALLISDLALQFTVFPHHGFLYGGWYYVYTAFFFMVIVGTYIRKIKPLNIFLAAVVVTLIHWLVTDFGVWFGSHTFPQTVGGYLQCLVLAIPFEWRFLAGTVVYSAILFGGFELAYRNLTVPV
jgi:hypothetical protein